VYSHSQNSTPIKACVACGESSALTEVLDLGEQPPANSFREDFSIKLEKFPLAINRCSSCNHVQLNTRVNPEILFKNYLYVSGTSKTMDEHFTWFADYADELYYQLNKRRIGTVLDVGCNDGSQLDKFTWCETFGVDPAENLHSISSKKHFVFNGFFDQNFMNRCRGNGYDVIIAQNVFAHTADPLEFLRVASLAMNPDSLLFIQTSQADMIKNNEFDTIYHEHISYFNISSMNALVSRTQFRILEIIKCPLHGNSFIFVLGFKNSPRKAYVQNLINMEKKEGLYSEKTYRDYAVNCTKIARELKETIEAYQRLETGFYAVGYGAAAKGMTLINYANLHLDFIIDDNPLKQNTYAPGSNTKIVSIDELDKIDSPILFVPLAWNFFDEIKFKIQSRRDNGYDLFCKYFPEVEVIE